MTTVPMDTTSALVAVLSASVIMKQTFTAALAVVLPGRGVHQGFLELSVPMLPLEQGRPQAAPQEPMQDQPPVLLPSTARTAGAHVGLKLQRLVMNQEPGRPLR